MKKAGLMEAIADFQEMVFDGRFSDVKRAFANLANALEGVLPLLSGEEQLQLVRHLNVVLEAYGNQDYLLVSDILQYEIRTLMERVCE